MHHFVTFAFIIFPYLSLAQPVAEDSFSSVELPSNYILPENVDLFPYLLGEEDMEFPIVSADVSQVGLDLHESPFFSTQSFVADSNLDTVQSGCGSEDGWGAGKLRRRDEGHCENENEVSTPLQWNPTVFDINVLSPEAESKGVSATGVLSEENRKCKPPYIYNLCCNGSPSGFLSVENFFRVWATIKDCDLSMMSLSNTHSIRFVDGS